MIAESGHYALVLALALALIQSIVPLIGARLRDTALMNVARSTALAQLLFVGASFTALVMLHVNSDFSVANVYENSHSMKPLLYKISGQTDGVFLGIGESGHPTPLHDVFAVLVLRVRQCDRCVTHGRDHLVRSPK